MSRDPDMYDMDEENQYPRHRAGEPPEYPICEGCGKPCEVHEDDVGIGSYEFWGQRCCDTQWVWLSDCCDETVRNRQMGDPE